MSNQVRVRIAPSPTGHLHVGTARSALYNLLFARHHQGIFILRLEDTDEVRSNETFTQDIIDGLKWLGMSWDEGVDIGGPCAPYRQTEKIEHYNQIANNLIKSGHAYFCYCTPEELTELKDNQKNAGLPARYDNRCRNLSTEKEEKYQAQGRIPAIRFKVDEPRVVTWHDAIRGDILIDSIDLGGDLVIIKSSGTAIYNFAVVIDDIDMKITHVIRGEDHIHNTAKQLLIYEALRAKPPVFAHVALMVDLDRHKLSKRAHGEAVHVAKYRKDGYMPEAMLNYLAQMSWTHPDGKEIYTLEEACQRFDLNAVSKSPAVFDVQRLNWFNSQYIRSMPLDVVAARCREFLKQYDLTKYSREDFLAIIACLRDALTTLSEIAQAAAFFFVDSVEIPADLRTTLLAKDPSKQVINELIGALDSMPFGDRVACKAIVDAIGKKLGLKGKDLYWPIRAALSGVTSGPDLGSTISILGKDRIKSRLEAALYDLNVV